MRPKLHTQHGITTREHLLNAGLSQETIKRWLRNGRLIAIHRGVYAVGHLPPSPHAKAMAAVLACGPTAVLSHRSAAHLWGLISYHGPIEVTVANTRRRPGVIVHRNRLTEADVTRHWDIPVTTAARTLTDLARVLTPDALTRAVNDARLRKILKTRGHFPTDEAATKLIWLALRNITAKWERGGIHWKAAMNQFAILYDDRFLARQT